MSSNFDIERPQIVEAFTANIAAGMPFRTVLEGLAVWRREVSNRDVGLRNNHFGRPRDRSFDQRSYTHIMSYPIIQLLLLNQLTELRGNLVDNQRVFVRNGQESEFERPLSYPVYDERTSLVYIGARINFSYNEGLELIMSPLLPDSFLQRAEGAFNEAQAITDPDMLRPVLARLFYSITVGAPYVRGTASIAEIVVEAVAASRGFTLEYPGEDVIVQTIAEFRAFPLEDVRNTFRAFLEEDNFPSLGRQAIDQFAHGSESVDEFVRFYERLVTLRRPAQPEADNATSACKCADNVVADA